MDKNDGLITNDEWDAFEDDLYHRDLKIAIRDNFINHLCDNDESCSGVMTEELNLNEYDIAKITHKQTSMFESIMMTLRDYTLEICMLTLFIQGSLFLLTIVDLIIGNDPNNTIRLFGFYVFRLFRAITLLCFPKLKTDSEKPTDTDSDKPTDTEMAPLRRRQSLL